MAVTITDGGLKGVIRKIIPFVERHEASELSLALLNVDILLAKVHITGGQGNVFSRSHSGVNQDEHVFHAFHRIGRFP